MPVFLRKESEVMYRIALIMLLVIGFFVPTGSQAGDWTGNVNAFLGLKTLDDDWLEEFQEQTEGGILFDIQKVEWPVSIVVESMYSMGEDVVQGYDIEVATTELLLGAGKTWTPNATIRPYVRAGINFASAEQKTSNGYQSVSVDESGMGYAISGGVYWTISQHFNIGLGVRYSKATIEFDNDDVEAGGTHSGLILGYHW